MEDIVIGTKDNFETEVINSDLPVIIDFGAPWCGYCKMLEPIFDTIASENKGKIKIVKINTDEQEELAHDFGIMGIPVVVSFKEGREYKRNVGFIPKDKILALLDLE